MRVATGPRRHVVTVLVVAGVILSSLLLLLLVVAGVPGGRRSDRTVVGPAAIPTALDHDSHANPWEAGDAAARDALVAAGLTPSPRTSGHAADGRMLFMA